VNGTGDVQPGGLSASLMKLQLIDMWTSAESVVTLWARVREETGILETTIYYESKAAIATPVASPSPRAQGL